ncbi:MAG: hypothetical protein MZW92_01690 [Comamonadaceae bacterium]|nr:hypothetical protein [Comamonadaceae bacterium]
MLADDLVHFEVSALAPAPAPSTPIRVTPQVARTDYPGPARLTRSGPGDTVMETAEARITVDPVTLCLSLGRRPEAGKQSGPGRKWGLSPIRGPILRRGPAPMPRTGRIFLSPPSAHSTWPRTGRASPSPRRR